jgi:hypothetical protein
VEDKRWRSRTVEEEGEQEVIDKRLMATSGGEELEKKRRRITDGE